MNWLGIASLNGGSHTTNPKHLFFANIIKNFQNQKKPTNLNEEQWVAVRTQRFKDWFGDWESASLINMAEKALTNKESKNKYTFSPSEKTAIKFRDLLGHDVNAVVITDDSIRHINKKHGQNENTRGQVDITSADIAVLPYIINNFDTMELSEGFDDKKGNKAIKITKQVNGNYVVATIEKGKDKNFVVTSWQNKKSDALDASKETPRLNVRNDSDLAKVQKDIQTIKNSANKSSKVVDDNGEPLVVYHGTNAEFNVFDINTPTKPHSYEATKIELLAGQNGSVDKTLPRYSNNSITSANLLNGVEKSYEKGKFLLDHSKVVDDNGEPLVVYHGTNAEFNVFDINTPIVNGRVGGNGFYFTSDIDIAKEYAGKKGNIKKAFLNLRNNFKGFDSLNKEEKEIYLKTKNDEEAYDKLNIDGFIVGGQIIVRNSNQIKSATDNVGTYSEDSDDIRYQIIGEQEPYFSVLPINE